MSLRIEVKGMSVSQKPWAKGDRKGVINEQDAWLDLPSGERRRLVISIEDAAKPYPVGVYSLDDASFEVDRFGSLILGRIKLLPLVADAVKVSALK